MNVKSAASFALLAAVCTLACSAAHATATIVINNVNAAGEGFNDTTMPGVDAGCQPGENLGQCRLRVFTTAAHQWGQLLNSPVTITVDAQMDPLECDGDSAVLGSAGPNTTHTNFTNAPRANTSYVQAEANALAGHDLSSYSDIDATFNVDIDDGGTCLNGVTGWWYDTDPNAPISADRVPLLPVVFHELAHGLGFISLYDTSTGKAFSSGTPIWGDYLYDTSTSKLWKNMTNSQRKASTKNDPDLVWTGPNTSKQSTVFLDYSPALIVNTPASIAGAYTAQDAQFGPGVVTNPVTGNVVLAIDGTAPFNDACETLTNPGAIAGKIALVDRGVCNFTVKVKNAQNAGATGVIVANNEASGLPGMGGADPSVTIPSLGVTQATGNALKSHLPVNATLGVDTSARAGTNSGCVRMFAPNPVQPGSSVSHFSSDAYPDLLMEPALNVSLFNKVDLTLPLFKDIGWSTSPEDILFIDGFDPSPCAFVQP